MTTIDVSIPEPIFKRLQKLAKISNRSVDEIVSSSLEISFPTDDDLPEELALELASMTMLNDDSLRAAIQPSMSSFEQTRLAQINQIAQERELTEREKQEQISLLTAYHRSVLRRSQALAILKNRGYSTTDLIQLT